MNESQDILLAKWLSGDITDAELVQLESQYDLKELKDTLDRQDQYTPEIQSEGQMWEGLTSKQAQGQKIESDKKSDPKKFNNKKLLAIGIGLLCLGLLIFFLIKPGGSETINTLEKSETETLFADGSFAIIGPGSELTHNSENWISNRAIKLEGQAFFNVKKGVPFKVSTSAGTIEVLGTQFDVWSIHSDYMRVACTEGKVKVSDNNGQSKIINKSEQVFLINGELSEVLNLNQQNKDWRQNFRNYQTTPVHILLLDLERFYEVSFEVDSSIKNEVFSGILPINDLAKCIRFLETSLSYESDQKENNVTFKKAN